ncbi:MAG: asparagine--tRNA ligase, partial [Nanoarchaeota archaeon]
MFISIEEVLKKRKGKVPIRGWVYRERKQKDMVFLVIRDSSNIIQCVVKQDKVSKKEWDDANKLLIESSVELEGILEQDKRAPTGYEIQVSKLKVIQFADVFPIKKDQSPEFLLDKRHLWIRSRNLTAVMKIRSTVMKAFRDYYYKQGFYEMAPPIFTPLASEGGATLFEVKYFDKKVYLTQSWQLYAEAAIFALEKIFCISPCFRAERSKTSRHLAEFWMAEMEAAWYNLNDLVKSAEECVAYIVQSVVKENSKELKLLGQDIEKLKKIKPPFPRLKYAEVLKMLKEKEKINIPFGKDLRTIEEDLIMKHFDKPLIVTHYPKEIMAFYKPVDTKNPKEALCFDMLAPEGYGELIGGSQRDININELKKWLKKQGEKAENYEWYFDTRKYGSVP